MPAGQSGASCVGEELWWTGIAYTLGSRPTSQADLVHVLPKHPRLAIYGTLLSEFLGPSMAMKVVEVRSSAVLTDVGNLRENTRGYLVHMPRDITSKLPAGRGAMERKVPGIEGIHQPQIRDCNSCHGWSILRVDSTWLL
jgi:hypothetical protein